MEESLVIHYINKTALWLSLICVIALPIFKHKIRKKEGRESDWEAIGHDVTNGFMLPHVIIIILSVFIPQYFVPDPKFTFSVCVYAIVLMLKDVKNNNH